MRWMRGEKVSDRSFPVHLLGAANRSSGAFVCGGIDSNVPTATELPIPSLPSLKPAVQSAQPRPETPAEPQSNTGAPASQPSKMRKQSFGLNDDPWGSPALHKGHDHSNQNGVASYTNGTNGVSGPIRTTSNFTTTSAATEPADSSSSTAFEPAPRSSGGSEGGGWGSYPGGQGEGFANSGEGFEGAGAGGSGNPSRATRAPKNTGGAVEEIVTVNVLDEKEGMFLFQHRNYEVSSVRRGSKVIRRYSDFVWLLDCLHKRYPFRQLPLLPPKRMASE